MATWFRPDAIQDIVDHVLTDPPIWHEVDDGTNAW